MTEVATQTPLTARSVASNASAVPDAVALALALEAPALPDHTLARPSPFSQISCALAIIVPLLGLIAAMILMWHTPFSWLNLSLFFGGYVLTTLGVTIGYHRLFTHKSYKTNRVISAILGILGSMSVQGPILQWASTHRRHHQHTDSEDDPHSPHAYGSSFLGLLRGMLHSHFGWFFSKAPTRDIMNRYVPDLIADPVITFVSRWFGLWVLLGLLIPAAIGLAVTQSWMGALMALLWGGLLRVFFVHHVTWSVNSACHLWGRQPFNTHDESRNNAVMGVLALGEGWHNTHHAFPASARHGLAWWEIDISYWLIRSMSWFGLAQEIKIPPAERINAKRWNSASSPVQS